MKYANLQEFIRPIDSLVKEARSVQVNALVVGAPGSWQILAGRVLLHRERLHPGTRIHKQFGDVLAHSAMVPVSELQGIIGSIERGVLPLFTPGGDLAKLVQEPQAECGWQDFPFCNVESAASIFNLEWPCYTTHLDGKRFQDILGDERIETIKRTVAVTGSPFRDVPAMCVEVGVRKWEPGRDALSSCIEFVVPVWMRLLHTEYDATEGSLMVGVETRGSVSGLAAASVVTKGLAPHKRPRVPLRKFKCEQGRRNLRYYKFNLKGCSGDAPVFLSHDGREVGSLDAGLADPRWLAHEHLDPGLVVLEECLLRPDAHQKRKKSKDAPSPDDPLAGRSLKLPEDPAARFELGVQWLFSVLGFSVIPSGPLGDAPDAVVESVDRSLLLVIECSLRPPADKKLRDLKHRAFLLGRDLQEIGHEPVVLPIVAIPQEVPLSASKQSNEEGVFLLDRNGLAALLERKRQGRPHYWAVKTLKREASLCDIDDPMNMQEFILRRMLKHDSDD